MDQTTETTPQRLRQQAEFLQEIDKLKQVLRRSYLVDGSRKENDAEHSWHLAMMVLMFAEYVQDVDLFRTMKMALIHDLPEIDAGDSFLYSVSGAESKLARERAAAVRILGILPVDQASHLQKLWGEFEAGETSEAKFVRALDRLQALLQICASGGRTWKEHKVTAEMALSLNLPIISDGSSALGDYAESLLLDAREKGFFYSEESASQATDSAREPT